MSTFPWLLALLVVPLLGAAIVMFLPKNSPTLAKQFGLFVSIAVFALTVGMALQFVTAKAADFQFSYSFAWIPAFGVNFALGVDGIALVAAFASQALILVFHLTGPPLDIRLHSLLVLASAITAACIAASLAAPRSAVLAYLRCISLLALGSFWIQTGDLSYKRPAFDTNEGVAIAPLLLLVHYAAWGVALLFFFAAVALPKPEDASGSGDSAGEGAMSMRRRHRSEPPRHKGVDVESADPPSDAAYAAS